MNRILPRSLEGLLLLNESAFLVLVIATAALSGLWAHFWTQSSEETVRINTLVQEAERIRGDMYRQYQEVTHARLTENPGALRVYAEYRARIADHFGQLSALARGEDERAAIAYIEDTYAVVHQDMDKVFMDPNDVTEAVRMKLLDPAYQQWMLGEFESALQVFDAMVDVRHGELAASRSGWTRWTPVVVPVTIGLAIALLLYTRQILRRHFVSPLHVLVNGAREISTGNLAHRFSHQGVAEIRQLAASFDQMTRKLAESQRSLLEAERQATLGALVPVVAHNIRNPLASIRATAQLMDATCSTAELGESRRDIISTVDRLERWVSALLSYLHPLKPRRRGCALGEVVDGALAPLQGKLADKSMRVERTGWNESSSLEVDPDLLEQALYALLSNAVEASPAGGCIHLEVREVSSTVELHIVDEGPGIGFEPAPRELSPGPTTKAYGTGLGIPIAYRICEAHGGHVRIRRLDEGGTSAIVSLPTSPPRGGASP